MSIISLLQNFKAACDAWNIHERAMMCRFKPLLSCHAETEVRSRIWSSNSISSNHGESLQSYPINAKYFLERYATDDNIAMRHGETDDLHQGPLSPSEFSQKLETKILVFRSVPDGKALKGMFAENFEASVCVSLRHWCAEHLWACLEGLSQKIESLVDLQGNNSRTNKPFDRGYTDWREKG